MDELQQQLLATFLEEAVDVLESLERAFLDWETNRQDSETIDKIFRLAHNLKGSSKAVGLMEIGAFTHDLETLMLKIKNREIPVSQEVFDLLLICNDELAKMVHAQRAGETLVASQDLRSNVRDAIEGRLGQSRTPEKEEAGYGIFDDPIPAATISVPVPVAVQAIPVPPISPVTPELGQAAQTGVQPTSAVSGQPAKATSQPPAPATKAPSGTDDSIRVSLNRVDSLVTMIGELVILQTVLSQQRHLFASPLLQKTVSQLSKITKEIQDTSMGLRMVPLKSTFQKMQRIVRDTSKTLGKDIDLDLVGEDTELDKTVVDLLGDALVHLIRNACDHGVETIEERIASGKPGKGRIRLEAGHEGGKIVITIADDGKGLDAAKLREKAIEKGIVRPDVPMTEEECHRLIFAAGFSTKAAVTDISGRGVGMDVVKTNVEKALKGEIYLETRKGSGTTFKIVLPLTLAIIEAMVVRCEGERYVVPLSQVHESLSPRKQDLHTVVGLGEVLSLRGENLPIVRLGSQLGVKRADRSTVAHQVETALVVREGEAPFAVTVDEILSRQQVVIKRLGHEVRAPRGITGGAVLGDGAAALILDLTALVNFKDWRKGHAA